MSLMASRTSDFIPILDFTAKNTKSIVAFIELRPLARHISLAKFMSSATAMDLGLDDVASLTQASIAYEYLHANSTTHESLFSAIAELVDNSRDAKATKLDIDINDEMLYFVDDGCGMSKTEVASIVDFGHSTKRMDDQMIGQYGNGLKSGTMRIGKDFMLFTKKDGLLTAMLLSRTFHEQNRLKKVFVPIPCFNQERFAHYNNKEDEKRHNLEMRIIHEYSPFKDFSAFYRQFSYIIGETGTLIVCYNLRHIETGGLEMDLDSNLEDIRVREYDSELIQEVNSLRHYLSVLYSNPRMRIYLRGKKVNTSRLLSTLYKPRTYDYRAKNLKAYAAKEVEMCEQRCRDLKDFLRMCRSNMGEFTRKHVNYMVDTSLRLEYRHLSAAEQSAKELLKAAEDKTKEAIKAKSCPKPISFYFGLNVLHRNQYGVLIYNNGRLITVYEKTACQNDKNEMKYLGIVGIVDVPYSVLEPTHNKQSFANKRDFVAFMKAFNDHMVQYWMDLAIEKVPGGLVKFWKDFGYSSMDWDEKPSNADLGVVYKRNAAVGLCLQCDKCLKWRMIDYQRSFVGGELPEIWECSMNPNAAMRFCEKPEVLPKIPEGKLTHAAKVSITKRGAIVDDNEIEEAKNVVKPSKSFPGTMIRKTGPPLPPLKPSGAPVVPQNKRELVEPPQILQEHRARRSTTGLTRVNYRELEVKPEAKAARRSTASTTSSTSKRQRDPQPEDEESSEGEDLEDIESFDSPKSSSLTRKRVKMVSKEAVSTTSAPDSASSPQREVRDGNAADLQHRLDKATLMIRRLLQINLPDGFDRMDVLTTPLDDLLKLDLDEHQRKSEKKIMNVVAKVRKEVEEKLGTQLEGRMEEFKDDVYTVLAVMPEERFSNLSRSNCLRKLAQYAKDLKRTDEDDGY
ncbi:hypothetical protein L596_017058 [Steinernema carpocapsae]|uniref:CW-type domain-containing protein n=1 Tax=Steinernema carpocapsae TaxID=34508 RepID=A0A4U5N0E1_STECR|nr:hypothetical protein L596_017058 [Steinernema carpocapsae]